MDLAALRQPVTTFLDSYPLLPLAFFWIFAWVMMLVVGNGLIRWLKSLKGMKWSPREDTPDSHLQKAGTPSMGGIGILGAATLSWIASFTLLLALIYFTNGSSLARVLPIIGSGPSGRLVIVLPTFWERVVLLVPLLCVLAHGVLGFADDWSKARGKGGLTSKEKLAGQCVLAVVFLGLMVLSVPHLLRFSVEWYVPDWHILAICALILIGTSNAVNITDGIDGLAAGLSVQVAFVYGLFMLLERASNFIGFGLLAISSVWLALGGACLGFLAFNKYPAKVFMGDTGSLALGAGLGLAAILTHSVFLLPFVGFMFYVEMFSVIAQVAYFKYTKKTGEGKRIFRRAPLHHHFELGGWRERHVVIAFWAVNALTTIIGLALWDTGTLPRFPFP